ncbi:hypothetical protein EVG20_g1693 [Dentipellis fragilis]|uniref:26S proteasome regulatory subunit 8 homolog n=1 Tax=Dentipellis fragilis TaxID=205917 RepID=A0A4Y9ZAW7_9AGAM|nr:hypothetical protein EVG20_g1693 [Dentipellis fragilis]
MGHPAAHAKAKANDTKLDATSAATEHAPCGWPAGDECANLIPAPPVEGLTRMADAFCMAWDFWVLVQAPTAPSGGIKSYYQAKIEAAEILINQKTQNLRRLEAQRNALNARVRLLREELQLLHEPGSYVGEIVKVMGKKKVLVKVQPEGKYIVDFDPEIELASLKPTLRVALRSDSYTIHKILPNKVDPLVSLMMVEKVPDSTYEMVGGLDKQIKEIKEVIELPVKHPELFESLGIAQPKGVLLYGPPGTGKTLLARAVAHHTDCKFIRVSGSELVQKYIGEGSRMVRELFIMAREHAPSIIFMDEIDSIGSSRGESGSGGGDSEVQRTMLELLNQLDGFEPTKNIKVIMATNRIGACVCAFQIPQRPFFAPGSSGDTYWSRCRIDILDSALLRPGRIDRRIEFPPPGPEARVAILRIHSRKMSLQRGINLRALAEKMGQCSGAEVRGICTEAGMYALRERRQHVTQEDFEFAVAKVSMAPPFARSRVADVCYAGVEEEPGGKHFGEQALLIGILLPASTEDVTVGAKTVQASTRFSTDAHTSRRPHVGASVSSTRRTDASPAARLQRIRDWSMLITQASLVRRGCCYEDGVEGDFPTSGVFPLGGLKGATTASTLSISKADCAARHDVFDCTSCGRIFIDQLSYNAHLKSQKHSLNAAAPFALVNCPLCDVGRMTRGAWVSHIGGKHHKKKVAENGPSVVEPAEASIPQGLKKCDVCNTIVPTRDWTAHVGGRDHAKAVRFQAYKAVYDEAAKDKHDVAVWHAVEGVDFGVVTAEDVRKGAQQILVVRVTQGESPVSIVDLKWSSSVSTKATPAFTVATGNLPLHLTYGTETQIVVAFQQTDALIGRFQDKLEIAFEDETHGRFSIVRPAKAVVGDSAEYEQLKPEMPYVPRQKGVKRPVRKIVEGIPPPAPNAVKWVKKLPASGIPQYIIDILSVKPVDDIVNKLKLNVIRGELTPKVYAMHFKTLIWVEEHRMDFDLQIFDIPNAKLTPKKSFHSLRVPGLAEKRPSVLIGDRILVQRSEEQSGKWFEGHVHDIDQTEVYLRFHGSFPKPAPAQTFHIRFKLNRVPMRRQHQALNIVVALDRLLFPSESHTGALKPTGNVQLTPFNKLMAINLPQLKAINAILHRPAGSPPFVLFGPPGTGKTVTIVEAIRQILKKEPGAHILACAPSNSAADLIASRLSDLGADHVFRLYAASRVKRAVPEELLPFTYINRNGHFSHHPVDKMCKFSVLITTCVSASVAHGIGMPRGHFSHIFIDEAGHATEPEAMVSIRTMADSKTNVILSGDPKQLGPIIRSAIARRLQLDISYMERLLDRTIYQDYRDGANVVKLLKNYRSHPAILRYPNERFYDGELEPCGDPGAINSFVNSPVLVSKKFPIVFHGMAGEDAREASSPSYFNVMEVMQVKQYVKDLLADKTHKINGKDIGIITPYHRQVQKIRESVKSIADDITVGSVEEFQGQERRVIIVSTVRSSQELVEFDLRHTLGFVANPRRFNVAVTRAQALLIVVGDPTVLSLDPLWRGFLNYVHQNNGWKGVPISWDPNEPVREEGGYDAELRAQGVSDINAFAERMQNLTLQGVAAGEIGDEDANEDQPWVEPE